MTNLPWEIHSNEDISEKTETLTMEYTKTIKALHRKKNKLFKRQKAKDIDNYTGPYADFWKGWWCEFKGFYKVCVCGGGVGCES